MGRTSVICIETQITLTPSKSIISLIAGKSAGGFLSNSFNLSIIPQDFYFENQADGEYHYYRFEWHSGGSGITPQVKYYYDGKYITTYYTDIPWHAGRWWLGIWFPTWIGSPNFNIDHMYIDWTKVTPYWEANDIGETTGDPANYPPKVTASISTSYLNLTNGNTALLTGTATDADGPSLSYQWQQFGGAAEAIISNQSQLSTYVGFTNAGDYVFKFIADDGTHVRDAITYIKVIGEWEHTVTTNTNTPPEDPTNTIITNEVNIITALDIPVQPEVSPNPYSLSDNNNRVIVRLAKLGGSINIYNIYGKQISQTIYADENKRTIYIDINDFDFSPGTYFIMEIETGEISPFFITE